MKQMQCNYISQYIRAYLCKEVTPAEIYSNTPCKSLMKLAAVIKPIFLAIIMGMLFELR